MAEYLSTDPNAGKYLSTDPNAGAAPKAARAPLEPFEQEAQDIAGSTSAERISANPIVRALIAAGSPIAGAMERIERPFGGTAWAERNKQLKGMQERGSKALGFSPLSETVADISGSLIGPLGVGAAKLATAPSAAGRIVQGAGVGELSELTTPGEAVTGKGAATGAGLASVIEGAFRLPAGVRAAHGQLTKPPSAAPAPKPTGEGAERVSGELQRIRAAVGKSQLDTPPAGAVLSEPEQLLAERTAATSRLPEIFAAAKPVDLKNALAAVDQAEQKALHKSMTGPIKEARGVIERAVAKSQPAEAPARMTAAEYRQMLEGNKAAPSLSLEMADEVRQSINAIVSDVRAKIEDKALAARTAALLTNIQNAVTGSARKASSEYGKWLDEYGKLSQQLGKFKGQESVLSRTTAAESGAASREGGDAQRKLETIFTGEARERDFKNLMDTVRHDPAQVQSVRQALGEWVTKPDPMTKIPSPKSLVKNWNEVRQSVQKSGLMDARHIKNVDTLIEDIRRAERSGATGRMQATVGGFFAGLSVGHPFVGSHFAREIGQKVTKKGMEKRIAELMTSGAIADADMAYNLSMRATPQAVSSFAKRLGFSEREMAALYPQQESRRRPAARAGEIAPPPQ